MAPISSQELPDRKVLLRVQGTFDAAAASELGQLLANAPADVPVVVDFGYVVELLDLTLATVARDVVAAQARVTLRGLALHHCRVLRYFGVGDEAFLEGALPFTPNDDPPASNASPTSFRELAMATCDWKTICCPVDSSEPARAALDVAIDLCRRLGSELVLLHVAGGRRLAEELPSAGSIEALLETWKAEASRLGVRRIDVACVPGQAEIAIVEFATAKGVDLIVMGTHGRVDREGMITGSVAEAVVRNAHCPVMTVHARP